MNRFFALQLILLILPTLANADNYEIKSRYTETSDQFFFQNYSLDYSGFQSDTWWPYINEPEAGAGWTAHTNVIQADTPVGDIYSTSFSLGIHNKRNRRNSWTLRIGVQNIDEDLRSDFFDSIFYIQSKGSWSNNSWYSFEFSKQYDFVDQLVLAGEQDQLRSYTFMPAVLFNGWKYQRLQFEGQYKQMDHDNVTTNSDAQWLYDLSIDKLWLLAGFGANIKTYSQQRVGYWSPDNYVTYGPRMESLYTIGRWMASLKGSVFKHKEQFYSEGVGYSTELSLQYGHREGTHVALTATANESSRASAEWRSKAIQLKAFLIY